MKAKETKAAAGKPAAAKGKRQKVVTPAPEALPAFCDYHCPYAAFAGPDAVGACRRELAVYCTIAGAYVTKNSPCVVSPRRAARKKAR